MLFSCPKERLNQSSSKMLKEGLLDELVTAVQDLAKALDRLGYGVAVERYR